MHIFSSNSVVAIFSLSFNKITLVLHVLLIITVAMENSVVRHNLLSSEVTVHLQVL